MKKNILLIILSILLIISFTFLIKKSSPPEDYQKIKNELEKAKKQEIELTKIIKENNKYIDKIDKEHNEEIKKSKNKIEKLKNQIKILKFEDLKSCQSNYNKSQENLRKCTLLAEDLNIKLQYSIPLPKFQLLEKNFKISEKRYQICYDSREELEKSYLVTAKSLEKEIKRNKTLKKLTAGVIILFVMNKALKIF